MMYGAGDRHRTCDLFVTKEALCQLSYSDSMVTPAGFAPATPGVSVPCSTPELQRHVEMVRGKGFEPMLTGPQPGVLSADTSP